MRRATQNASMVSALVRLAPEVTARILASECGKQIHKIRFVLPKRPLTE